MLGLYNLYLQLSPGTLCMTGEPPPPPHVAESYLASQLGMLVAGRGSCVSPAVSASGNTPLMGNSRRQRNNDLGDLGGLGSIGNSVLSVNSDDISPDSGLCQDAGSTQDDFEGRSRLLKIMNIDCDVLVLEVYSIGIILSKLVPQEQWMQIGRLGAWRGLDFICRRTTVD